MGQLANPNPGSPDNDHLTSDREKFIEFFCCCLAYFCLQMQIIEVS